MKKTKIILPAIALLAVSGIASVTGTVAWFTAANTASFNLENVTAVATDSSLLHNFDTTYTNVNCTATTEGGVRPDKSVTDSSFNASEKKFYKANFETKVGEDKSTFYKATSYYEAASSIANAAKYCVSWQSIFSLADDTTTQEYDLFISFVSSTFNTTANDLEPAWRIAAFAGNESFVWAPKKSSGSGATLDYVEKKGAVSDDDDLVNSYSTNAGANQAVFGNEIKDVVGATTKRTEAQATAGYLGSLTGSGKVTVTFVVWCEGTDSACVTANENKTFGGTFSFYSRSSTGYSA